MPRLWGKYLLCCSLPVFIASSFAASTDKAETTSPTRRSVRISAPERNAPERPDMPVVPVPYVADGTETLPELEEAYRTSREFRKRMDVLLKLIEQYPDEPDLVYKLAGNYTAMRWYDDSIDAYVRFTTKWPDDPRLREACIAISDNLHRSGRAEDDYKFLLTLPRDTPEWDIWVSVKMSERLNYTLQRDYELSVRLCEELIAKYPDHPLIHMAYGRLADNYKHGPAARRDYGKAKALYERLVERWPDDPGAFFWNIRLSEIASSRQDYKTAIKYVKVAIERFPEDYPRDNWQAFNRYTLGNFYSYLGDRAAAEREWMQVVERYPKDTWADFARRKLALPSVPEDASYTLRTATFRLDAATGLTVRLSAPEIAPMLDERASAVFELWDNQGPVDDPELLVTADFAERQDWGAKGNRSAGGRYEITWPFTIPGNYRLQFRLTASGKTYHKGDLDPVPWEVGPPLMPVFTPVTLKGRPNLLLLDVSAHASEWVKGALRVPWSEIEEAAPTLPKDRLIAVYRTYTEYPRATAVTLKKLGFDVVAVKGGIKEFKAAGWPTEKEEP